MTAPLPTGTFGEWSVTDLRDSIVTELNNDTEATTLSLFFYAVTTSGWNELRRVVRRWKRTRTGRTVTAYVGTDHALTDPRALVHMRKDGVSVRLMSEYQGVFHPKVVWLLGPNSNSLWVGSNNLTRDGLLHNVEFAVAVRSKRVPASLERWVKKVAAASEPITDLLIQSYEAERNKFESGRAKAKTTTFTWRKKREPSSATSRAPHVKTGDLILEVMPKETGSDGRQLQLPMRAAGTFFGVSGVGKSKSVDLESEHSGDVRRLTITVFRNKTVRVSVCELDYRDRPCVMVFRKKKTGRISYEIVPESIFPSRYKLLLARCANRTRLGSRRWGIS